MLSNNVIQNFVSDHMSNVFIQSLYSLPTMWHWTTIAGILLVVAGWYLINRRRASRRNHFVSDKKFDLSDATNGELTLLSYNIAGLPEIISGAKLPRAKSVRKIGQLISGFDIVGIQEDFNYNSYLYEENQHPFRTQTKGKVPFGDGLNTLSKYPILESRRITWKNCAGTDCLTPKGFAYLRIQIAQDVSIDVYNLHATAHTNSRAVNARRLNKRQLADYIIEHSAGRPVVVMGDFNAHYAFEGDDMHGFKELTGAVDPWVDFFAEGVIPQPSSDFLIPKKLELTDEIESIDKILYRNGGGIIFTPKRYKIEHQLFVDDTGRHLSDHLAVSLLLTWEK